MIMKKILVLADTHSRTLPDQLIKAMAKVDFIIHAGDICDIKMFSEMQKINDVEAVFGNMDEGRIRQKLPRQLSLICEGVKIGVTHGEGSPKGLLERVREEFKDSDVDIVIFGHSHEPLTQRSDNKTFFNPGSPTDDIFAPYCSYGILEIDGASIKTEIVKVK